MLAFTRSGKPVCPRLALIAFVPLAGVLLAASPTEAAADEDSTPTWLLGIGGGAVLPLAGTAGAVGAVGQAELAAARRVSGPLLAMLSVGVGGFHFRNAAERLDCTDDGCLEEWEGGLRLDLEAGPLVYLGARPHSGGPRFGFGAGVAYEVCFVETFAEGGPVHHGTRHGPGLYGLATVAYSFALRRGYGALGLTARLEDVKASGDSGRSRLSDPGWDHWLSLGLQLSLEVW